MNAEKCKPLPFGMEIYRERYIKAGRTPDETEIRFFMAAFEVVVNDSRALTLARMIVADPNVLESPENKEFYSLVLENYHRRWEHAHVPTHAQICADIQNYMNGGQGHEKY